MVRQLKEAHSIRKRIDEIIEDAQLLGEAYLDAEETEKIKDCYAATVDAANSILEDAIEELPNLSIMALNMLPVLPTDCRGQP